MWVLTFFCRGPAGWSSGSSKFTLGVLLLHQGMGWGGWEVRFSAKLFTQLLACIHEYEVELVKKIQEQKTQSLAGDLQPCGFSNKGVVRNAPRLLIAKWSLGKLGWKHRLEVGFVATCLCNICGWIVSTYVRLHAFSLLTASKQEVLDTGKELFINQEWRTLSVSFYGPYYTHIHTLVQTWTRYLVPSVKNIWITDTEMWE